MGGYNQSYQHVVRIGDDAVKDILYGKVYIFPKIDGTNSVLWFDETVQAGSRRRVLTKDGANDNAGFREWALAQENIKIFFSCYPNLVLYGEWLVKHTISTYRKDAWRKFYVFDVATVDENGKKTYLPYDEYSEILQRFNIEYLAPLKIISNPSIEDVYHTAQNNNVLLEPGEVGEGVVCKNYDYVGRYGEVVWAKYVLSEFKERHYKTMGAPEITKHPTEEKIAQEFITVALVEKEHAKIVNETGNWESVMIPRLLNTVWHSLIEEEMWNIIKKHKNPIIDFKMLERYVKMEVKRAMPQLF